MHVYRNIAILHFLVLIPCFVVAQTLTHRIHLDQFGYLPSAKKVAVISDPQLGFNAGEDYTPGTTMSVVDAVSGDVVFTDIPVAWNGGATHDQSGDKGWWFDFSELIVPGRYYLLDESNTTRSYEFEIKEDVYYELLKTAGRMFFYNRCGMAKSAPYTDPRWEDGSNFSQDEQARYIYDQDNANLEKDLSGGWFDAGDYNKYITFASATMHELLDAYGENPMAFRDDWNIPESGNGIPDILDEVRWELDWMKKMQQADGAVILKMGSRNYNENTASPPSANTDTRYYGPTCTSAAITVAGVFAHAALVFDEIPELEEEAGILEDLAVKSWDYVLPFLEGNSLEENCDDGSIVAGDADRSAGDQREEALMAAIYLFAQTNDSAYGQYIIENVQNVGSVDGGWWGIDANSANEALLYYTTLANADFDTKTTILNSLLPHAEGDWNGFFRFNEGDLYRAYMPDWSYYWGSNSPKARYSTLAQLLDRYEINTPDAAAYREKAAEQIHYFHGVNPLGIVMLSNMYELGGDSCVNQLYHGWFYDGTEYDHARLSPKGPALGYVTGGPNPSYSFTDLSPPAGQPTQKAYLDFNLGWPESSWEISEPAIYYQSAYIRALARYVNIPQDISSTTSAEPLAFKLYPNPAQTEVRIVLPVPTMSANIRLSTLAGVLVLETKNRDQVLNISRLPAGSYLVEVEQAGQHGQQLLIKK